MNSKDVVSRRLLLPSHLAKISFTVSSSLSLSPYWTCEEVAILVNYAGNGPPRGGGVAGASAPGPGGPKGARRAPSQKIKACVKRGGESEAEMGWLKTVHQTQHASSLELKFFEGPSGPPSGPH